MQLSPTILRVKGFRLFFYSREWSGEGIETRHVHVRKGSGDAKVWLDSGELAYAHGFGPAEIRVIAGIVLEHRTALIQAWDEHISVISIVHPEQTIRMRPEVVARHVQRNQDRRSRTA